MTSAPFLLIDQQPISVAQVLQYLNDSGKLEAFVADIVRQYLVERALKDPQYQVSDLQVQTVIAQFRQQQQLTDAAQFEAWLASNGLTLEAFRQQMQAGMQAEQLRTSIVQPNLQSWFIERKLFLDRLVLSRIVVDGEDLADELNRQLAEGASFEAMAREYSITEDRIANGMVGPVSRGSMPDELRAKLDVASPGDVVGPVNMEGRWGLFRLDAVLPASLEDEQVRHVLEDELFELWLTEQMKQLDVRFQVEQKSNLIL
ncbi:MAG: peptidylprolyl isomerase [Kaiparowitsia implicata GSE-PSE-MK54-09C]|jgi:parvulin-like peptidyl-prolyl isomerase|nr:peptidylprolyl isomerase [Kaiparowitsia implicata GSE-PSE-MK54-09C]